MPVPEPAPNAARADCLVACGPGVERIAEEVRRAVAEARTAVVTSDTLNTPDAIAALRGRRRRRAIDIIIGTQMVTKGYHFPISRWSAWSMPILALKAAICARRAHLAADRAGRGRAGRGQKPGEVLIQTRHPTPA
jgi:primosomal protein N' (replication factor Y) (superfamily II helicase)